MTTSARRKRQPQGTARSPRRPGRVLDVPVFGQRIAECGNTSLKAVLHYHGKRLSAARLARLARANEEGIDHQRLIEAALATGASVFARSGGTLAELRWFVERGYPVIVGWWASGPGDPPFDPRWTLGERKKLDCGHFSVVIGMDSDAVWLMDPQWGRRRGSWGVLGRRRLPAREFLSRWYDTDTDAFVLVDRWYMVAHFGEERFAKRFGGRDFLPGRA